MREARQVKKYLFFIRFTSANKLEVEKISQVFNYMKGMGIGLWIILCWLTRWFLPSCQTPQLVNHIRRVFIVSCHRSLEDTNISLSHIWWSSWYELLERLQTGCQGSDTMKVSDQTLLCVSSRPSCLLAQRPVRKTSSRFISGVLKYFHRLDIGKVDEDIFPLLCLTYLRAQE